uniref:PAZ domain-containing protein n=1 Tax=Strongyloides papillosus TaxID=174720 RepID=A0A0N5C480_STREA
MKAKINSGVSDRGHEMYLSAIKKALPQPNKLLVTIDGTRNYFKKGSMSLSDEAIYQEFTDGKFVIYNARRRIHEIFRMYDTISGKVYRMMNNVNKNTFLIGLQLHFDGGNSNKTNKDHQIFPFSLRILNLPPGIRNKFELYISFAIYCGIGKPPFELMEEPIRKKFKLCENNSIVLNGREICYNIQVINFTADIIAKTDFLRMKHFKHTYGCSLCFTASTTLLKRAVYISAIGCTLRTRNSMIDDVNYVLRNRHIIDNYHGHKENLPMFFDDIMYPYVITVDWFHSVFEFYANNEEFIVSPLSNGSKEMIDYKIDNNKISRCFTRKLRKLECFGSYKASEMKLIFLYIFPLSMFSIINSGDNIYSKYVLNTFLQIAAVGSLLNNNITNESL